MITPTQSKLITRYNKFFLLTPMMLTINKLVKHKNKIEKMVNKKITMLIYFFIGKYFKSLTTKSLSFKGLDK